MTVWFEDEPSHNPIAELRALARRESLELPVCADCLATRDRLQLWSLAWFSLGCALLFAPHVIGMATGLIRNLDDAFGDWRVLAVGVTLALYPMTKGINTWQAKDRGGLGLALVSGDVNSVTLVVSVAVARRIEAGG